MPEPTDKEQAGASLIFYDLIACPNVLSIQKDRIDVERSAGGTVKDLMRSIGWTPEGLSVRVFLDGQLVRDAAWGVGLTPVALSVRFLSITQAYS